MAAVSRCSRSLTEDDLETLRNRPELAFPATRIMSCEIVRSRGWWIVLPVEMADGGGQTERKSPLPRLNASDGERLVDWV